MKYAAFAVGLALGLTLPAGSRHLANRVSTDAWPIERFEDAASPPAIPGHGSLPRNIILFLADGLGFPHLTAAEVVLGGIGARTVWDRFDAAGWTRSHPTSGFLTDSAASATAFATGSRTYYGGIGVDASGAPRMNLFESAAALGYWTGIVTDSYVWDATPAAFIAHVIARGDENAGETFSQVAFAPDVAPALLVQGGLYALVMGFLGGLFPAVRAARVPIVVAFAPALAQCGSRR